MQNVSQEWKDNQAEMLVGESDIELSMRITDPDAYEDASASDNGSMTFSQTIDTVSGVKYDMTPTLTFEQNLWLLDGSGKVLDNADKGTNRYIGNNICNINKTFAKNPVIDLTFTKTHSNVIQGVTIVWSTLWDEYAEEFIVTAYNGDTVVATQTVTDNTSIKSIVYMDISNYNKITIEVVRWSMSYRRARIEEIIIGVDVSYGKSDLFSYKFSQSVNPLSIALSNTEMSFGVNNLDKSFNPYNAQGLSKYLVERQEVKVRYGYKINDKTEWIDGGTGYLSEWDAPQDGLSATFKTSDLLGFMRNTYYGGTYFNYDKTLYELAEDVLRDANLPTHSDGSVKWKIDRVLEGIYVSTPLPIDTHANCLQLIANLGQCAIFQNRDGILEISRTFFHDDVSASDYSINYFNSFSKSNIELSKPVKEIKVSVYTPKVTTRHEIASVSLNVSGTQEVILLYEVTATDISADVSGGTIDEASYYSNACKLKVSGNGLVTVTVYGNKVETTRTEYVLPNQETGETVAIDNPLISNSALAFSVGDWVKTYYNRRMTLSSSWRADPRLDALDVVRNENDYGESKVIMTDVTYDYNGAFKGSGEGKVI